MLNEILLPGFDVEFIVESKSTARRLHDAGKSGWAQLVGIIPIVGWIVLIVWLSQDSKPASQAD